MINQIVLHNPPFEPASDQVIYLEWLHDESINAFIRNNYEWIKKRFRSRGLYFCYLPILGKDLIKYNAPQLSDAECEKILESSPSLTDFIEKDESIQGPVLAFSRKKIDDQDSGDVTLYCVDIVTKWYKPTKAVFTQLVKEIVAIRNKPQQYTMPTEDLGSIICEPTLSASDPSPIRFSIKFRKMDDEEEEREEVFELVKVIKEKIDALRNYGVSTMFLHDIIDEQERLSRLVITKDYKILLPDYDNMEIEMAALPKAVFLLYLRHPEGIRFKELPDYYAELLQIYRQLNPMGSREKQESSIRDVTDPLNNSINEKCSRIREAFVSKFDDRLARNYYITGKRGGPKLISLDREMIHWE